VPGISRRSEQRVRRLTTVVVVVVGLAACGGGGGSGGHPLTTAQLVARVNTECQKLQQASTDLTNAQNPSAHGAVVARYLHAASSQLRSRLQAIGALVPPSSLASQVSQFVVLLNRYADGLDGLANRTKSGDTYAALLDRSTSQVNSLNSLSDQADRIASKLGFTACET
jgi:hypothetical protein